MYREITERPLFIKGRRPPEIIPATAQVVETNEASPFPAHLRARAAVITPEASRVLLYDRNSQTAFYVAVDDMVEGWRVTRIERHGATLTRGHQQVFLKISGVPEP